MTPDEPSTPRRVLVVDDNEDSADLVATLVEMWGHDVRVAHNGEDALRSAKSYLPEVVLLDIGLPDLSGYEVARRLRAEGSHDALLVALSGYGQPEDREKSTEAGFDEHLTKPVDPGQIEAVLLRRRG